MSSLRLAHTSRSSDRNNSSSSGPGGITNEAFATSSISLYKRISSNENLSSSNMMNSISTSSHLNHLEAGPPHPAPRMMMMSGTGQANSTTVLTVPGNSNSSTTLVGNASPKSRSTNDNVNSSVNISPKHNSSPSSSTSSNAAAPYYQHQVHNHQTQPGQAELIAIKTKFEAEFRRFSLQRSEITNLDDFMKTIEHFHKLFTIPFCLFYTDPHHGDLLPINNDINFALAISSAKPLLRLIVQRKDGNYGYFPAGSTATHKKNFLGTLLPSSSSSHNTKPRLAISAPEDFRQVSSIIDVDIVPDTCRRVRLVKHGSDKPLGFYIRDGTSVRVTAHGVEKVPGIFISRLIPGGLAESTGLLAVNDEVLEVNGIEVNGKSLDQVTDMMVANSSNLIITIRPANQRGHSTLSGSFSSNTLSSSTNAPQNTFHTANQTNSLERGQRAKKTIPSIHPSDQFHNPHHPLHYSGGGHVINHNPQSSSSSSNAFESLQRSAQHRHSATIISTTNPGGSSSSGHHHFDPVSTFHHAHHPHQSHQHQPHSQHHHHHHHNQFSNNRHSVIGGPGVAEGLMVGTGGLGAPTSNVILARDHSGSNSSDDEEDEVRDHFTTSLVINSGADANKPSSSSLTGGQRTNGGIYNTTVTINHHPQTTLQSSSSSNVSSTTVPVNRTSSSGSTGSLGQGQGQGSGQAAAASAAAFIRNSLRTKNHPANAAGASGPTRTFVEDPRTSIYAHLYHHNQPSEGATAQQNPNPSSPSSSASSSPTVINKQIQNQRPGGPNNNASVDSDIVTL